MLYHFTPFFPFLLLNFSRENTDLTTPSIIILPTELGKTRLEAPFGKVPYLEVDGKKLPESYAVNRYLARKFGELDSFAAIC